MEIQDIKQIPIEDFLARLGYHPVQRRANALWYKAPYREERTASFKVNPEKNLWYDFGEGKGGNIFALAGEFIHCDDFIEQARYVAQVAGMPVPERKTYTEARTRQPDTSFENVRVEPLRSYPLLSYMQERGISAETARENCREVYYTTNGRQYFAVGFPNVAGGCEIRNRFFKGCLPPKDVTVVECGSETCHVYEGFMDYLSARMLGIGRGEDHLVLNSVSNVSRAFRYLDGYGNINCHLDNDVAGKKTLEVLRTRYGNRITDCSGEYGQSKDLNEHLQKTIAGRHRHEDEKKNRFVKPKMKVL